MKTLLLLLALLSPSAFAAPVNPDPGSGPVEHDLNCTPAPFGVFYELDVTTQAVDPQDSVTSMEFLNKTAFSRGAPETIELKQDSQDLSQASFSGQGARVQLDKASMAAKITLADGSALSCQ